MPVKSKYTITGAVLATVSTAAVVDVPVGTEELALKAREGYAIACEDSSTCPSDTKCCLIAAVEARCLPAYEPCNVRGGPLALGAFYTPASSVASAAPNEVIDARDVTETTITINKTLATSTVTLTLQSATPNVAAADTTTTTDAQGLETQLTTQLTTLTSQTTGATVTVYTIPTPTSLLTSADGSSSQDGNTTALVASTPSTWPTLTYQPTTSSVVSTTTEQAVESEQSTVTSVAATVDSTTSTASLNGEPSAVASDLSQQTGAGTAVEVGTGLWVAMGLGCVGVVALLL